MKKTLLNILLGTALMFGAGNKSDAQTTKENVEGYNIDGDVFYEEKLGYIIKEPEKKNKVQEYTLIYYSDKNNDNFYENLRIFNVDNISTKVVINVEDFYIDKNTGLINYNWKQCFALKKNYYKQYSNRLFMNIVKENDFENFSCKQLFSLKNLTKEQIYNTYSGFWGFYGGFGERVKKLINAGKEETKLKEMVNDERNLWEITYK